MGQSECLQVVSLLPYGWKRKLGWSWAVAMAARPRAMTVLMENMFNMDE